MENLTAVEQRPVDGREAVRAPPSGRPVADLGAEQDPVDARGGLLGDPDEATTEPRPPQRVLPVEWREVDTEAGIRRDAGLHRLQHRLQLGPPDRLRVGAAEIPDTPPLGE